MKEMMTNTPDEVIERSRKVAVDITSVKKAISKSTGQTMLAFNMKGRAITDKEFYDLTIVFYVNKKSEGEKEITFEQVDQWAPTWVRCSCPYFKFFVEYVLDRNGSTVLRKNVTDNKPPKIRNPEEIPYVCKHLYKALPMALAAAKKVK